MAEAEARLIVRPASESDLPSIEAIQVEAPGASQWKPQDYLAFDCRVAVSENEVVGFMVSRLVAEGEFEILNLAVSVKNRRQGVGRCLFSDMLSGRSGDYFLEVRESNAPARKFYEHLGFEVVMARPRYYSAPDESGLVMKFHSC